MMTIGYGASDPFFNDCYSMAFLVSFQAVVGTILDAVCIGLLYDRISRATVRACALRVDRLARLVCATMTRNGRFPPWPESRKHGAVQPLRHHQDS